MEQKTEDLTKRGLWTSASSAEADYLCPGRHAAQKGLPDVKSDDAEYGTQIHAALEKQNSNGLTSEQESTYESCVAIEAKVLSVFFPNAVGTVDKPIREQRLWLGWADGLRHSGQVDCAHIINTRALILEYKTLPSAQPASPKNLQLRDQAILLYMAQPLLKEIGVAVIQPLVTHSPEITVYQTKDLDRARDDLYRRVHQSNQPNAPRMAGEVQCKFCRAKPTCPEYSKFANSLVSAAPAGASISVSDWTPEQRTQFMDRVGVAAKWLEDCKDALREMIMKDPEAVPGYTLKEGRNNPTIINPAAIFEAFKKLGGTQEQFIAALDIGKGKLSEAVAGVTKLKGLKLEAAVKGVIGDNVTVTKNRPSIIKKS